MPSSLKLLLPAALLLVTAAAPLPTATASTCTVAAGAVTCTFLCSTGFFVTVTAPAGVTVTGTCGGATASCIGPCAATSALPASWSGNGTCVSEGAGATCTAFDTPSDPCTSDGAPALGVIPIISPTTGQAFAYVDDRNFFLGNGVWVYIETNYVPNLQRGGWSYPLGIVDPTLDPEICNDGAPTPDTLVL